jgi:alcohol dehydrogenase class IV
MEFNKDACANRLALLCDAVYPEKYKETINAKADYIISEIKDIVEKVDIPTNLESFGVKKGDIDFLVQAGSQQTRLLVNNCKELSLADIRYIYNKLF